MSEWTIVSKSKAKTMQKQSHFTQNSHKHVQSIHSNQSYNSCSRSDGSDGKSLREPSINFDALILKLKQMKAALSSTIFGQKMMHYFMQNTVNVSEIIALGVGDVLQSSIALLQLAVLLFMQSFGEDNLRWGMHDIEGNIDEENDSGMRRRCKVSIFEPLFTSEHKQLCDLCGIVVLNENKYGRYNTQQCECRGDELAAVDEITPKVLYYMPHCPHGLYNNVLWANWDQLEHIIIMGNSFSSYNLRRALISPPTTKSSSLLASSISSSSASIEMDDQSEDAMSDGEVMTTSNLIQCMVAITIEVELWDASCDKIPSSRTLPTELFSLESAFIDTSFHAFHSVDLLGISRPSQVLMDRAVRLDSEMNI